MCGIAGYFSPHFTEDHLRQMTGRLAHRGPDADGFFVEKWVGLGHRRLSIIDLSDAANQPMVSRDGRYVLVYNGEIYNYKELAKELNVPLRTRGDTEVLLELFAKEGVACLNKLNGMFAFAVYDRQEKKGWLVRDRLGIKPLFYWWDGQNLAFASELKALRAHPVISKKLKTAQNSIYQYLHLGYIPEPVTIYESIFKFPAGAYALFDGGDLAPKYYWRAEDKIKAETITDFEEAKRQFKELLHSSVGYRMISDVPFGTFLSGGIDSSLVTAVAQQQSDQPVKTFSIAFDDAKYNEAPYARAVAKHLGTDHHEFYLSYSDALPLLEEILESYDEPYADSSAIPTMLVSKMARQEVKMTLSGDGGDELFMGYGAYKWAERLDHPLIKLAGPAIERVLSSKLFPERYRRAAALFNSKGYDKQFHIFSQEQYLFSESEINKVLIRNTNSPPNHAVTLNLFQGLSRSLSPSEKQALFDLKYYLEDDLLVKVDRASMKYSLETRVPLLDYRIVEFALNLDPSLKIRNGELKWFLKQVLYDYVPKELFDRPKWGFAVPLKGWLKGELKHLVKEYLNPELIRQQGIVDPKQVNLLLTRFNSGQEYLYNRIWQLIILNKFIGQR